MKMKLTVLLTLLENGQIKIIGEFEHEDFCGEEDRIEWINVNKM